MKIKIIQSAFILSLILISFFSCDNNMINTIGVSGKVYYNNYSPASGVKVTIGNEATKTTSDGSFTIANVPYPYDVTILDSSRRTVTIYQGLTTDKPILTLDNKGYSSNIVIEATLPEYIFELDLRGKLIFTDGEYINSYSDINSFSNKLYITFPQYQSVPGKLILILYKKDSFGQIISYENYGEKNIIVRPGENYSVNFDSASIALNPGELTISGSFSLPLGTNVENSYFGISFTDKFIPAYYGNYDFSFVPGRAFSFIIPTGLPSAFTTNVNSTCYVSGIGYTYGNYKVFPGSSNILEFKSPVQLNSPSEGTKNVSPETVFSFSSGSGEGVHSIVLNNNSREATYRIVTTSNQITMEGLDKTGLGAYNNNNFYWSVSKMGPFSSMNDFAENRFNVQEWFLSSSFTQMFSTEP